MNTRNILVKIRYFFLTKIIVGIAIIVGLIFFTEWFGHLLLAPAPWTELTKTFIINGTEVILTLLGYIIFFKWYENRKVDELKPSAFWKNATGGFISGFILQSLFILVIYYSGNYSVIDLHPFSFVLQGFIYGLTAGFVAEILILGVGFRIIEEKLGTVIALSIMVMLFVIMHTSAKDATWLSVSSTVVSAGILLPAVYVYTRSLWFPIFLHFAWDFAEPAIYGGINPSLRIDRSWIESKIAGTAILTGGKFGPQSSLQSLIFCSITAFVFLLLAYKKNNFSKPFWKINNEVRSKI
ncbi:MAG TPA: CPBP family intramembrane glutamic endopeptidase [Puia sp.]|nr:CPBP family intramembrane glutamic endopeptidase [Puia sp.]